MWLGRKEFSYRRKSSWSAWSRYSELFIVHMVCVFNIFGFFWFFLFCLGMVCGALLKLRRVNGYFLDFWWIGPSTCVFFCVFSVVSYNTSKNIDQKWFLFLSFVTWSKRQVRLYESVHNIGFLLYSSQMCWIMEIRRWRCCY